METTAVVWRKSSRSGTNGGGCVEVAAGSDQVMVRDSKDPSGPFLAVSPDQWRAFLTDVREI
jgi:hypothetical protein